MDETGVSIHEGWIRRAVSDPEQAFRTADLILVTVPAMMMRTTAELIFDHADVATFIGVVPGNGGSECAFRRCIERGNVFFGIERVPAIARLVQKGRTVMSNGYRKELHVASLPSKYAEKCADIIRRLFDIDTVVIPNFLNLTMTPSNPILHTTRLRTIFENWEKGVVYRKVPLFYEEWDDASSTLLIKCDDEVQGICKTFPDIDLRYVRSLKANYECQTVDEMTKKISSIAAFKGLKTPVIEVDGGFIPDLHSRYFTSDFSFGLAIIKQIAEFAGVPTPNIDATLSWYKSIAVETEEFRFEDYGIDDIEQFREFYLQ